MRIDNKPSRPGILEGLLALPWSAPVYGASTMPRSV